MEAHGTASGETLARERDASLATSALGCHERIARLDRTSTLEGPVMLALVGAEDGQDGPLELAVNSAWRADPLGLVDSRALLRRRYAAAVRDPLRSPWRQRLRGLYRAVPHHAGVDPFGERVDPADQRALTSELILLDGRYVRITTTSDDTVCESGTWRQDPIRDRVPREILDGLERRRAYDLPVRRFAAAIDVADVDPEYCDIELLAKACVERAIERPPTDDERTRGDVAGLDIAVYTLLDQLVWSAADLSDLLTGLWSPWSS